MTVKQIIIREESPTGIDLDKIIWIRVPDGFTVTSTADCDDDYEVTDISLPQIVAGIDFEIVSERKMVTESEALMAMMIWEFAMDEGCFDSDKAHTMDWLKDGEGAYQGRDNALLIAKVFMRSSDWAYANGFDDSEDWEFIPRMLPEIQRREHDVKWVTSDICMEAAKEVVRLYLEDREEEKKKYMVPADLTAEQAIYLEYGEEIPEEERK